MSATKTGFLTPQEVADRLQLHVSTVHVWINAGELKAANVSSPRKPRWRISEKDLAKCLDAKSNQTDESKRRRARLRRFI